MDGNSLAHALRALPTDHWEGEQTKESKGIVGESRIVSKPEGPCRCTHRVKTLCSATWKHQSSSGQGRQRQSWATRAKVLTLPTDIHLPCRILSQSCSRLRKRSTPTARAQASLSHSRIEQTPQPQGHTQRHLSTPTPAELEVCVESPERTQGEEGCSSGRTKLHLPGQRPP